MNAPADFFSVERWRLRVSDFEILQAGGALADVRKAELIDGDIYSMSPASAQHSRATTQLAFALVDRLTAIGSDLKVIIGVLVVVADDSVPEPDIVVSSYKGNHFMSAETVALVVEVAVTTLGRDLGRKAELYAAAGIPKYRVVDVNERRVMTHRQPGAGGYGERDTFLFGDKLVSRSMKELLINTQMLL